MPLFDMPEEELLRYKGKAILPDDFDAYWDRALAEMEACGTDCALEDSDFKPRNARCGDLWFRGVGGARVHARFVCPRDDAQTHGAVLLFHGYHRNAGSWSNMMRYAAAGLAAFALDSRGQGGLSQDVTETAGPTIRGHIIRGVTDDDPDRLLLRSVYLDAAQLARIVMGLDGIDASRVYACGASQGGGLALACAALTPTLRGVVPIVPFLCDFRRAWELADPNTVYELHYYFSFFDPRHRDEGRFYRRLGYVDNVNLARRIRARTLLMTGLQDHCCPPSTQFAAYNAIPAEKRYGLWPECGHEVCPDMEDEAMRFLMEDDEPAAGGEDR